MNSLKKWFVSPLIAASIVTTASAQVAFNLPANNSVSGIDRAEYFVDTDPGSGLATSLSFSAGNDISISSASIPTAALTTGYHSVGIRTHNAEGWSLTSRRPLFIFNASLSVPAGSAAQDVSYAEYFFDTDPGFGNGTGISFTAGSDVVINATVSLTGLSNGVHRLYIRTRNAANKWSITALRTVFIVPNLAIPANTVVSNIDKAEYFFDTDPGYGMGTDLPFTAGNDINISTGIGLSGLSNGIHRLYIRTRNTDGNWSHASNRTLFIFTAPVLPASNPAANVVKVEYFFDTDPGYGNGTQTSFTAGQDVSTSIVANLTGLSNGVHRLYIRTQDTAGRWSVTNNKPLSIIVTTPTIPANATPGNITKLEYFFDTDPGYGNGTTVNLTPTVDLVNYSFAANITGLSVGAHVLYIRTYDGWSSTSSSSFMISNPLPVTWLSFNAKKESSTVQLDWRTGVENSNAFYTVQRSGDGKTFDSIGMVKAKNSNNSGYEFTDEQPLENISYYRIKQTDVDGKSGYSHVLSVRFSKEGNYEIYPNPATDIIYVKGITGNGFEASITDVSGKVVIRRQLMPGNMAIDVSSLAKGIYYMQVEGQPPLKFVLNN